MEADLKRKQQAALQRDDPVAAAAYRDLLSFKESKEVVWGVEILTAGDERTCEECRQLHGKKMRLDMAIKVQPLPHSACTNARCRCVYLAVLHDEKVARKAR